MKRRSKIHMSLFVGLLVATGVAHHVSASDQVPAQKQSRAIALVGGTVHTVSGPTIEGATIVFDDGKIVAIGRDVNLPRDIDEISISGKHVYPGLIAANTSLGLVEINSVRATRDFSETGDINPSARAEVSINPDSELIPVARANGLTMAVSVPLGGTISGTSALIALDGWTWEDLAFQAPLGMHLFWPRMAVNRSPFARTPAKEQLERRDKNLQKITATFEHARAYLKAKEAVTKRHHDTDTSWEAMIPVLKKEIPVFIHANGIAEMQAAIDWASSEDIKMVIVGGADAWRLTDLLVEKDIPVIIGGIHRTPSRRWEDFDTPFTLPLKLHEAGVRFCIATRGGGFGTAHVRNLPYHAAMAVAYGLPQDVAIKALTMFPADILGVGDRVGSLVEGKDATLIVTDGDPLEITTQVEMSFIQGRPVDLASRHTQLYEKYQAKYRQKEKTRNSGQISASD